MQRNHHAEALLRGCRQVPDWHLYGGRPNAYALEWVSKGVTTDFYERETNSNLANESHWVFWVRLTADLSNGDRFGLFGVYDTPISADRISVVFKGDTSNGNTIELYNTGTLVNSVQGLGTTWHQFIVRINTTGFLELWMDGVKQFTDTNPLAGAYTRWTLGRTERVAGTTEYLDNAIVDEIAFLTGSLNATTLYNSGVPYSYGKNDPAGFVVSYEVEKDIGAINNKFIYPTVYNGSTAPSSFDWKSSGTNTIVDITTDTLRSVDTNPLKRMAGRYGLWVSGSTLSGSTRYAISGSDLSATANGLMPYPAGGGYSTLGYTGAFIGNEEEPHVTPQVSISGNMLSDDSTAYQSMGGTNSLGYKVDSRDRRLFAPTFVKKV